MTGDQGISEPTEADSDFARWRQALTAGVFEDAFAALEAVVEYLERGQLRLEETLACYELGVRLAERCGRILDEAQLRVTSIESSLDAVDRWDDSSSDADDPEDDETG